MAQFKVVQKTKWHSFIEVLKVSDLDLDWMSEYLINVQAIHQKL